MLEPSILESPAGGAEGNLPLVGDEGIVRGVRPPILIEQVRNTVPYLFDDKFLPLSPFARRLRVVAAEPERELAHDEYFALCVAAHYATVASFVPTDVDNQIRFRLWHPRLENSAIERMARLVLESRHWDVSAVTTRGVTHPEVPGLLSGHDGEWFSTAVGAYAALRKRSPELSQVVLEQIVKEMEREAALFEAFWASRDGIGLLKCATIIAHNLGDLDRVMDMWNLGPEDALSSIAYKAGHGDKSRWRRLTQAGDLNKALMADENHRHFALRGPKCLRRAPELQISIGPFFDDWGRTVALHPLLAREEVAEIAEALVDGWVWLSGQKGGGPNVPTGYARALCGIMEHFAGGLMGLANELPARVAKRLKTGTLRAQCAIARPQFEEKWTRMALNHASRAMKSAL